MSEKALTLADLMPFVCEVYDENDEGWCGWRPPVDRGEWDAVSGDDGGEGTLWRIRRSQLAEREAEVERLRQGLLQCATEAGEDVSDGIPDRPDVVDWAVRAVKETRAEVEEDNDRFLAAIKRLGRRNRDLRAEVKRLREAGDALAEAATGFCVVGQEPALNAFYRALATWHTATGEANDA